MSGISTSVHSQARERFGARTFKEKVPSSTIVVIDGVNYYYRQEIGEPLETSHPEVAISTLLASSPNEAKKIQLALGNHALVTTQCEHVLKSFGGLRVTIVPADQEQGFPIRVCPHCEIRDVDSIKHFFLPRRDALQNDQLDGVLWYPELLVPVCPLIPTAAHAEAIRWKVAGSIYTNRREKNPWSVRITWPKDMTVTIVPRKNPKPMRVIFL